ncbi:MAG: hypothetical protein RL213_829 [Bacteroidota bacterium]|jgi:glycine/D-amino acid oxidase-like deaminating enzyme
MLSFWERESFWKNPDVVIIGSGIVGLNAAIRLRLASPSLDIKVVERGFLPWGASSRNAGFACFGSISELLDDLDKENPEEVYERVAMRWQGLRRLRELLGDASIGYEPLGGYEIFTDVERNLFERCRDEMEELNRRMKDITREDGTYEIRDDRIGGFGFEGVRHMIHNRLEGQIDTGAMMQALMEKAKQLGIGLFTGVEVERIEQSSQGILLITKNGFQLPARRLLVATNGFAARLFPELQVDPARAQVLVTKPVKGLRLKGSFHYEEGYYYFRNIGDRILLGGGRNLDFSGETTTQMELTAMIQERLQEMLSKIICPYTDADIDMRWSGIMGMGPVKSPIIRRIDDRTVCAVRMGGMGVAIGSVVGEKAADLLLETL